ncbi:MAG: hypothetical protein AAFV53_35110, partial [Myxococcota bacterium]
MKYPPALIAVIASPLFVVGCQDFLFGQPINDTGGEPVSTDQLPADVEAVFQASCATVGCHASDTATRGVDLEVS